MAQIAYATPGRHFGPYNDSTLPYYGARFRLRSNVSAAGYSNDTQILITALKKYGIIFADQGTGVWITGDADPGYSNYMLPELNQGIYPSKRIPFDNNHWEMTQSIGPIVRGWDAPSAISCNSISSNTNPNWKPNWNPSCPSLNNNPSGATIRECSSVFLFLSLILALYL